jgi:hypothetical protein
LLTNNSEISLNINDNIGDPLAASSPKPPPPPRNKKRFYVQNNLFRVLTVHFGQIQRTEAFPYFSHMDGLVLTHTIGHHLSQLSHAIASESHVHSWEQIESKDNWNHKNIFFQILYYFFNKENYCKSCLVLNDKINEISLQQYASFSVPTQIYYWDLHVSSFKKISIFVNSDRHIYLLIRILLSNQVEL